MTRQINISPRRTGKTHKCLAEGFRHERSIIFTPYKRGAELIAHYAKQIKKVSSERIHIKTVPTIRIETDTSRIDVICTSSNSIRGKCAPVIILDDAFHISRDATKVTMQMLAEDQDSKLIAYGTADKLYSYKHLQLLWYIKRNEGLGEYLSNNIDLRTNSILDIIPPQNVFLSDIRGNSEKECIGIPTFDNMGYVQGKLEYHGNPFVDRIVEEDELYTDREY